MNYEPRFDAFRQYLNRLALSFLTGSKTKWEYTRLCSDLGAHFERTRREEKLSLEETFKTNEARERQNLRATLILLGRKLGHYTPGLVDAQLDLGREFAEHSTEEEDCPAWEQFAEPITPEVMDKAQAMLEAIEKESKGGEF